MFRWLDRKLLNAMQGLCDKVSELTGTVAKFKLEKWSVIIGSILYIGSDFFKLRFDWPFIVMDLIVIASATVAVCLVEQNEIRFLKRNEILVNSYFTFPARIFNVILWAMSGISMLLKANDYIFFSSVLCIIAWIYFSACVPKPPCKSKVRQWYEKAIQWFRDLHEPASMPEPSS